MAELIPLHSLQGFLEEAIRMRCKGEKLSPEVDLANIGFGLLAIAEQLQVANKIAAAQVLATLKNGYDERDAKLLLNEVREEYGV